MKKFIKIALVLLVLLVVTVLAVGFFLGSIVKKGVETFGPRVAQVEVKLDSANISLLSGKGALKGIFVGNPPGFNSPSAIQVGEVSVAVKPGSVMSDKIVVESVHIDSPEITMSGLKGDNLQKILDNIQASTGSSRSTPGGTATNKTQQAAGKKIQVDDLLIQDGKLNVVLPGLGTAKVALPTIHLTDLGKGSDGLTPGELASIVLKAVLNEGMSVATSAGKNITGALEGAGKEANKNVEKVTKGIGNLFK